ncbi:CCA tRNA nucleotidyltransferase [Clostridium sp. Marseille-P299]|uniref:CCA tRNA nucleotidyltransferase n=1 Tax=Clostridium sp. Marseille-P299 TaxID=1805477 RepID=UPI0008309676|nr:CCA tRNA nucleotidyltransferase [Clostridium sp. Marseille-P299]
MTISLPSKVNTIINELMKHGHDAYAVGGCIRDSILGRIPEDWDITTSASPYEVKDIFHRTIDTGIQHGTVTVMFGTEGFEVTTYRIDGEYEDNRHPKQVEFTTNLIEDLKRRDFTINAMAYNEVVGLVDAFDGLNDINNKMIRCVGSAKERFDEDALRILRAVRFSAQLNFEIENETLEAVKEKAENLCNISAERIREELNKLLLSDYPEKIVVCYETGITKIVLNEFDRMVLEGSNKEYSLMEHCIKALKNMRKLSSNYDKKTQLMLMWSVLLKNVVMGISAGDEKAKEILKRLRFDNDTIAMVTWLIKHHGHQYDLTPTGMRKAVNLIGIDAIELLFLTQEADILAMDSSEITTNMDVLHKARKLYADIIEKNECVNLKMLSVNGKDLIDLGYTPGKELGVLLEKLLIVVLENPEKNTKEELLQVVQYIKPLNEAVTK